MIRVGPAGWSYPDWEGAVYPRQKPRGFHPLRMLARYVDCIEINSSFYATPRADYCERWVDLVRDRPDFRFTAKLQNVFTHQQLDEEFDPSARSYLAGLEPLRAAGRLSACLVQFPLSFHRTRPAFDRLARLAETFGHLKLVLEVRHRSWFDADSLGEITRLGYSLETASYSLRRCSTSARWGSSAGMNDRTRRWVWMAVAVSPSASASSAAARSASGSANMRPMLAKNPAENSAWRICAAATMSAATVTLAAEATAPAARLPDSEKSPCE